MPPEISSYFALSIVTTTLAFTASVWVIAHVTLRKLKKPRMLSWLTGAALIGWFFLIFIFGKAEVFAMSLFLTPGIMIGFLVSFFVLRKVYLSPSVRVIADAMPIHWVIATQTYRVVGVGFLNLHALGLLPAFFAYPAGYGDILVGVTAPFVAYWYAKKKPYYRALAIAWNYIGIADLAIAIGIGTLGFPRPIQTLPLHPSTELFSLYPMAIIPLFAVPLALILHLFSLRAVKNAS